MQVTIDVNDPDQVVIIVENLIELVNDLMVLIASVEHELTEGSPDDALRTLREL